MNNGWCITVDTGGTFTDVVVSDEEGKFTIGKALTTPDRIFVGLREAIENASSQLGLSVTELLERTQLFVYGTTRATNAIVTRKIAKTAFLTTKGFPDVLVLREGVNLILMNSQFPTLSHTFQGDIRLKLMRELNQMAISIKK